MRILGLDEAGRGPVIGPLVVGGALIEADRVDALVALGVTDSKVLSRARREALHAEIATICTTRTLALEPAQLEENLTQVELGALAALIDALAPDLVQLDAPVPPAAIPHFVARLQSMLAREVEVVAENKAEVKYPAVAAASVVAKVARDRAMLALHARYGDLGWGYPAEPKTQAFLARCAAAGAFPDCVRARWATVQRLKQRGLFG